MAAKAPIPEVRRWQLKFCRGVHDESQGQNAIDIVKLSQSIPPRAKSPSIVLNKSTHRGRSTQALLSRGGNENTNYTDANYVTVIFIVGFLERLWITVWIGRGVFSGHRHKMKRTNLSVVFDLCKTEHYCFTQTEGLF